MCALCMCAFRTRAPSAADVERARERDGGVQDAIHDADAARYAREDVVLACSPLAAAASRPRYCLCHQYLHRCVVL